MPEPVTRYGFISFSGSRFDYNSPAKCRRVVIQIAHYQCPLLCACLAIANYELLYSNKAKWFAKQLASLVYQSKAKVLEFPSKKSDTLSETIPKNILSPRPNLT